MISKDALRPAAHSGPAPFTIPCPQPPAGAKTASLGYLVPFYDTDAMGVVHHSNYVRYFELGRVAFLEQWDEPYENYVARGLHAAVSRVDARYHRAIRFNDSIVITCWLNWVKGVSLGFGYVIHAGTHLIASAITEHAMINGEGLPARIPKDRRDNFLTLVPES